MTTIEIADIPTEWMTKGPIIIHEGCLPVCACMRRGHDGMGTIVVHTAIFKPDGTIAYELGAYCSTREQADKAFEERCNSI